MLKVRSLRDTLRVTFEFSKPILEWRDIHSRFFKMIKEGFAGKIAVQLSELSATPGASTMADLRARWAIYGGSSSVTLFADRLEFDFPVLIPSDRELVWTILRTIHDLLPTTLDNWQYNRIESRAFEHLEIPQTTSVSTYLKRFEQMPVAAAFHGEQSVFEYGAKFKVASQNGDWSCDVSVEKSMFNAAAVFVTRNMSVGIANPHESFDAKAFRFQILSQRCLAALGLENANAAA